MKHLMAVDPEVSRIIDKEKQRVAARIFSGHHPGAEGEKVLCKKYPYYLSDIYWPPAH